MYQIAVCDDEEHWGGEISEMVAGILNDLHIEEGNVDVFLTGDALLSSLRKDPQQYSLLILDIILEQERNGQGASVENNGVALAKKMRAEGIGTDIIFLTSCGDYALEGYEVQALRYVMKPPRREKLAEAIRHHYEKHFENQFIKLRFNSETRQIRWMDIVYLEVLHNRVTVHTAEDSISVSGGLTEWSRLLPDTRFLRCHKSFCVNTAHIKRFKRYEILLKDGRIIPIGKTMYNQFKEAYLWSRI